jgi:phosphoenolpyruvate synthase/pyruvate phosphate dikinase
MIAHARLNSESASLLQVPKAAAVTTMAYKLFVHEQHLESDLNKLLEHPPEDLEHQLVGIRDRFVKGKLPVALQMQLNHFLSQFDKSVRFAVRSSSTQEDAGSSSFAGQLRGVFFIGVELFSLSG